MVSSARRARGIPWSVPWVSSGAGANDVPCNPRERPQQTAISELASSAAGYKIAGAFVDGRPTGNLTKEHIVDNVTLLLADGHRGLRRPGLLGGRASTGPHRG